MSVSEAGWAGPGRGAGPQPLPVGGVASDRLLTHAEPWLPSLKSAGQGGITLPTRGGHQRTHSAQHISLAIGDVTGGCSHANNHLSRTPVTCQPGARARVVTRRTAQCHTHGFYSPARLPSGMDRRKRRSPRVITVAELRGLTSHLTMDPGRSCAFGNRASELTARGSLGLPTALRAQLKDGGPCERVQAGFVPGPLLPAPGPATGRPECPRHTVGWHDSNSPPNRSLTARLLSPSSSPFMCLLGWPTWLRYESNSFNYRPK